MTQFSQSNADTRVQDVEYLSADMLRCRMEEHWSRRLYETTDVSRVVPPALCMGTNIRGDESVGKMEDECSPTVRKRAGKRQKK
jgi:hypothetical protein